MTFYEILCIAMQAYLMYAVFADKNDNIDEQIVSIPGATVLLHCPMNLSASHESWSKGYQILSQGKDISLKLSQSKRLKIISDEDRSYSLEITYTTKSDVGIYCCDYTYLMDTSYQYCTDLDIIDEPFCLPENIFDGINGKMDQMTLKAHIYNTNISDFIWWTGKKNLFNDGRYGYYSNVSFTEQELLGNIINVTVTTVFLKISNLTSEDFNRNYTVTVKYDNRNLTCSYELPAEDVPETPLKLEAQLVGTGIRLSWVSKTSKAFKYPIKFHIKYKSCNNETCHWKTLMHNHNSQNSKSIFNLSENTDYYIVMYAENIFGKSNETDIITIKTGRINTRNQEQENSIFKTMTEKLLISLTSTLLVIVTLISCCHYGRQYRSNRINAPSFSNQASTSNAAIRNGHYEEIDADLEINVSNSLSPGNDQIENHDMHDAAQISMPTSTQTIHEMVEQTVRDISMQVLTETIAKVFKEHQLDLIKETIKQVLSENHDLPPTNTNSTSSTVSEHDADDESGYLNPYQPLHINVDRCEHPYSDATLNDDTLNICKREIKNYPIDTLAFHSENAASEL